MPLRSPKMNRFIFGFQRLVWCPKWTPASSNCFIVTTATASPPHRFPGPDAAPARATVGCVEAERAPRIREVVHSTVRAARPASPPRQREQPVVVALAGRQQQKTSGTHGYPDRQRRRPLLVDGVRPREQDSAVMQRHAEPPVG